MQNTTTSDQQMTDIFQAAQQKLSAPITSSTTKLNPRQKALLTTAAVLLGGGATFAAVNPDIIKGLFGGKEDHDPEEGGKTEQQTSTSTTTTTESVKHNYVSSVQSGTIKPGPDIDIAGGINDNMAFEDAYTAAREEVGAGGIFSWHGQVYNTYTVEEWQGLSLAQRQEFLSNVGFKPTEDDKKLPPTPTPEPHEPIYVETLINGHPALGIDDDHDGMADSIVIMDIDSNRIIAIVDNGGDNRLDTFVQIDMTTQEIMSLERLDKPYMAEMSRLESMNKTPVETKDTHLVALPEEETPETVDEEATDEGYENDANMDDMAS